VDFIGGSRRLIHGGSREILPRKAERERYSSRFESEVRETGLKERGKIHRDPPARQKTKKGGSEGGKGTARTALDPALDQLRNNCGRAWGALSPTNWGGGRPN